MSTKGDIKVRLESQPFLRCSLLTLSVSRPYSVILVIDGELLASLYSLVAEDSNAHHTVDSPLLNVTVGSARVIRKTSNAAVGSSVDDH
jgi:hypothetical protein